MKKSPFLLALVFSTGTAFAWAAHDHAATDKAAAPEAAWLAQAKADYPLKTCVVSGEEIGGSMGAGIDFVYQPVGKPGRLVRFCCRDCRKDFDQDPAKYLQRIDEAAAQAKKN